MHMGAKNTLVANLRLDPAFPGLVRGSAYSSQITSIRVLCTPRDRSGV
jgi:hypothetical protein